MLLLSMPWSMPSLPSLSLALLKPVLRDAGIDCDTRELRLELLRYLKYDTYMQLAVNEYLSGFVFTGIFEPQLSDAQIDCVRAVLAADFGLVSNAYRPRADVSEDLERLLRMRREVIPRYLDDMLEECHLENYSMVGFSCILNQTWASLALAQRIRSEFPKLPIVFGGSGIAPPIGPALQRAFLFIDAVAYADGEPTIVPLAQACVDRRPLRDVPGIYFREADGNVVRTPAPPSMDLDQSPTPDFDDFFDQRDRLAEIHGVRVHAKMLPAESSRGCWYGEHAHCIFCGISDEDLRFRAKSPAVLIAQLDELNHRYNARTFRFSDLAFPHQYFRTLLPELAQQQKSYQLVYEAKANLTSEQVRVGAEAGLTCLQLGVESFSTPVLKNLRKGVTAIHNIFAIRELMLHKMEADYYLLFEVPGDKPEYYRDLLGLLPRVTHLQPPSNVYRTLMIRHAPMAETPERFGLGSQKRPHFGYDAIFSPPYARRQGLDWNEACYYFDRPSDDDIERAPLYDALQHQYLIWRSRFDQGQTLLAYEIDQAGSLCVWDSRFSASVEQSLLSPAHAEVYDALVQSGMASVAALQARLTPAWTVERIRQILTELDKSRLLIQEGERFLALAFHRSFYGDPLQPRMWWRSDEFYARYRDQIFPREERVARSQSWNAPVWRPLPVLAPASAPA